MARNSAPTLAGSVILAYCVSTGLAIAPQICGDIAFCEAGRYGISSDTAKRCSGSVVLPSRPRASILRRQAKRLRCGDA